MVTYSEIMKKIDGTAVYKPGDKVPKSGIYEVLHDTTHPHHEVTCIEGKTFPGSRSCPHPRYRLKHEAVHIDDHPDTKG